MGPWTPRGALKQLDTGPGAGAEVVSNPMKIQESGGRMNLHTWSHLPPTPLPPILPPPCHQHANGLSFLLFYHFSTNAIIVSCFWMEKVYLHFLKGSVNDCKSYLYVGHLWLYTTDTSRPYTLHVVGHYTLLILVGHYTLPILLLSSYSFNSTFCPDALPQVPAVMLGVLGVSGRDGSHGELVLKDGTGDMICEVRGSTCLCFPKLKPDSLQCVFSYTARTVSCLHVTLHGGKHDQTFV